MGGRHPVARLGVERADPADRGRPQPLEAAVAVVAQVDQQRPAGQLGQVALVEPAGVVGVGQGPAQGGGDRPGQVEPDVEAHPGGVAAVAAPRGQLGR